jgi:hypothetical protein
MQIFKTSLEEEIVKHIVQQRGKFFKNEKFFDTSAIHSFIRPVGGAPAPEAPAAAALDALVVMRVVAEVATKDLTIVLISASSHCQTRFWKG